MVARASGVVLSMVGGRYRVWRDGEVVEARLRGRLKQADYDRVLVGDRVTLGAAPDGTPTIESVVARRSVLRRRSPGRTHGERPVAANVEQVVVVGAARQPDWTPQLMDRFTAVAAANGLPLVLVINKSDLDPDAHVLGAPYGAAGYAVLVTSALEGSGLDALRGHLDGRTSVFTGPTGVGKSTLLNVLQPGLKLRTADVSPRSHGGRHTTVAAEMHPFGTRGFVVDTPGLRDVGLWGLEPHDVAAAFPEFAGAGACRFDNCRHLAEPGCAVVVAAESGAVAPSRLESYRRLLREAMAAARPWARDRGGS